MIKKLFKEHSIYMVIEVIIEIAVLVIAVLGFVYEDKLDLSSYPDVKLLIENLYSQTWWGLVLLSIGISCIMSLTCLVYKKLEYYFISICMWCLLLLIATNINASIADSFATIFLFAPIIVLKVICYYSEKNSLNKFNKQHKKRFKKY